LTARRHEPVARWGFAEASRRSNGVRRRRTLLCLPAHGALDESHKDGQEKRKPQVFYSPHKGIMPQKELRIEGSPLRRSVARGFGGMRSSDSANAAEGSPNAAARLATSQASQAQRITRTTVPRRSRRKLRSVGLGGARDGRSPSQGDPAVSFGRRNPNRMKKIHPTRWPHAVVSRKHRAALLRG
jgi:hypothetical protein